MRRLEERYRLEDGSSSEERCSLTEKSWIKENRRLWRVGDLAGDVPGGLRVKIVSI